MFKCWDCGRTFAEPHELPMERETGYIDRSCPYCGSDRYDEVHECPVCGLNYTTEDFCEECKGFTKNNLSSLRTNLGASESDFADIVSACLE